ncbi:DUF302 domain-containing protein [candidate division KSB1 bacterium]
MNYYISTFTNQSFEKALELVTSYLKDEGFGIITEIDVKETMKNKLDIDFKKYKILGACNPQLAFTALTSEDKVGVLLPCNVVVIEQENGMVEISAMDPVSTMEDIGNKALQEVASLVYEKLKKVLSRF